MREGTQFRKTITEEQISSFVEITEDDNPIHTDADDESTAHVREKLNIEKVCAHGPLVTALICKPIMEFGGPGTVLLETGPIRYLKPVQAGDTVVVECEPCKTLDDGREKIKITIQDNNGEDIVRPTYAIVLILD